ncbi:hypothetical protein PC119_g17503 [Phytophthora cactorum]|uniref:Uncharacterized protein n=1 Tax=Phytophthora cactorum TaxID=29920 RepID=A0A8T1BC68_9STRA|nr:hypothetical protein PC115_g17256 [Phytophthora cactorum]KAG2998210.1 hypothetical protein PC119_g17503 [Phytophthora cactorum]
MDLHPRSPPQLSTTGAVSTEPLPGQRRLLGSLQSDEASSDSAWEPLSAGSSGVSSAEDNMAEASDSESLEEYSVDGSIVLSDDQLREEVTSLIQRDNCEERCLQGKAAELYNFSCSLSHMSSREKKQSVMTALAMRMKMDTALGACAGGRGAMFSKFRQLLSPAFGVRYKEVLSQSGHMEVG